MTTASHKSKCFRRRVLLIRMNKKLNHIAYHEAGHAAMMLIYDKDPAHATITPNEDKLAQVGEIYNEWADSELEEAIVVCYAGKEAEIRVGGNGYGSQQDNEEAEIYLKATGVSERGMRVKTNKILDDHWELVEAIARELLRFETLTNNELHMIYEIYRGEATISDLKFIRNSALHLSDIKSLENVGFKRKG